MIKKLWDKLIHAFWRDELAAKRWLKGSLLALLALLIQLMVTDAWMTWTLKQWGYHLLPGVLAFIVGSIQSTKSS